MFLTLRLTRLGEEEQIWQELKEGKPLPIAWALGLVVLASLVVLYLFDRGWLESPGGWLLLVIPTFGAGLALAASVETGNLANFSAEMGRSLIVAGLLAFAVWLVDDLRRPIEEQNALRVTLGLQQEMPGIDLHDEDLEGFDFAGRNLEGANLEGAQLTDANLQRAKLAGAELAEADLARADLDHADLAGADLSDADLREVEANKVVLREARMLRTDLSGAELSGANMRDVCLAGGSLVDASLPDAHLERAALTGVDLEGAEFTYDLRPAYLDEVGLDGAEHTRDAHWPPGFAKQAQELTAPDDADSPAVVSAPDDGLPSAEVLAVSDGDTVLLSRDGRRLRVRMIGIDAPDLKEDSGAVAKAALLQLLPLGSRVSFASDERHADDFGRHLLYLFDPGGQLVNQLLVERGADVTRDDPPSKTGKRNVRYAGQLKAAESWAREHALGLWRGCPG
jgi:uncharacterized protein YjbI with pentapeptide repeats